MCRPVAGRVPGNQSSGPFAAQTGYKACFLLDGARSGRHESVTPSLEEEWNIVVAN